MNRIFKILKILSAVVAGIAATGSVFAADLELITSSELDSRLNNYVIMDARPLKEWKKGHIPGAVFFSWENYTTVDSRGVPYRILSSEYLSNALGNKGISETTHIVVYGDADTSWGGEGWICWVLSWLGHKGKVMLLDGGFQGWEKSKNSMSTEINNYRPTQYIPELNESITISTNELETVTGSVQIVDTRSFFERVRGKIPGSVHISWKSFFAGKEKTSFESEGFTDPAKKEWYRS